MRIPDEMNRITPGCLAIIVGDPTGRNTGKIVQCIKLIPKGSELLGYPVWNDLWEIDRCLGWESPRGIKQYPYAPAHLLQPISGDQFYSETDKQRERDMGWLKDKPCIKAKPVGKVKTDGVES